MRDVMPNILLFSCAVVASAQLPKNCSSPPVHPLAALRPGYAGRRSFAPGEKVYYDCAVGYTPSEGSLAAQCERGKWSTLTLKCEKMSCGYAGDLPHGEFIYEGNAVLDDKVQAVCNAGYTLKGAEYLTCKSTGWMGEFPSCEKATRCPELKVPNGKLSSSNNGVRSVVTVSCGGGYTLIGPNQVVCLEPGRWSEIPECAKEAQPICSDPVVPNAKRRRSRIRGDSAAAGVFRAGDWVTFTCAPDFQLDGVDKVTCGPAGQWEPPLPKCLPSIETTASPGGDGGCGVPVSDRPNVLLKDSYLLRTRFASGERVYYGCDVGYVPASGSRMRHCIRGRWTPLLLTCERRLCGNAGEIANGHLVYSGVEFGDTATAVCNEGYVLVGRETLRCLDVGWEGRLPVCEVIQCEEPPATTNAKQLDFPDDFYPYGTVIRYKCSKGTPIGDKHIWCTKDGNWSSLPPNCKDITCPAPDVPRASWVGGPTRTYRYRERVTIHCHLGHTRVGPSTVTCGMDGRWAPSLPKCRRVWQRMG